MFSTTMSFRTHPESTPTIPPVWTSCKICQWYGSSEYNRFFYITLFFLPAHKTGLIPACAAPARKKVVGGSWPDRYKKTDILRSITLLMDGTFLKGIIFSAVHVVMYQWCSYPFKHFRFPDYNACPCPTNLRGP